MANLEQTLGVTKVTAIQAHTIPVLQADRDALVRSQTGSGKTLAYAIPIIEKLHSIRPKLTRQDGMKVMIVLPTRELAIQTYEWFVKLVKVRNKHQEYPFQHFLLILYTFSLIPGSSLAF